MQNLDDLIYWINERYEVYLKKEAGEPKPWSTDPVFQQTYFCNVHRENDRVTRWIRQRWDKSFLGRQMVAPAFNMMVARMVNKPSSLEAMDWPFAWGPIEQDQFTHVMSQKGSWGSAYIVSTNGNPTPKHEYIRDLLTAAWNALQHVPSTPTLASANAALRGIQGLGSFMSAQIIADLKNTPRHELCDAPDWWYWCAPGPGSLRGMAWVYGVEKVTPNQFSGMMQELRIEVDRELDYKWIPRFCNQDLQNCLCEFDKFMRVSKGTGRSKRKYNGTHS